MTRPDLDAIEARVKSAPQVIPHYPQDDGTALLCLADDDTDVGRLWPVGREGNVAPMHALVILTACAKGDLTALLTYARDLEATLANERGTGPTPDGWYWADGQWNREVDGGIYTVDRNPCPTDDDINCDCPWLPTTWTARFSRWDDEECKNTKVIGTYDTAREAIRAASVTP